jgi:hypothetical protein
MVTKAIGYTLAILVILFVINILLCNRYHGKLEVIDKNKFYCKNCK